MTPITPGERGGNSQDVGRGSIAAHDDEYVWIASQTENPYRWVVVAEGDAKIMAAQGWIVRKAQVLDVRP